MKKANLKIINIILILILSFVLCFDFTLFLTSCGSGSSDNSPDGILSDILKNYRTEGMASWWEIVAVYNANENPMDYKGYDGILSALEDAADSKMTAMASYVIVTDIVVIIGADEGYFEQYGPFKAKLKNLLENPSPGNTINDYIFGYYALKCSGMKFDQNPVLNYLLQEQKPDGGFSLSGDTGDVDITAFAIPALKLLYRVDNPNIKIDIDMSPLEKAVKFLENNITETGAFTEGNQNANSTAVALSAFRCYYNDDSPGFYNIEKALSGLSAFKLKKEAGYSYLKGGKSDVLATAQAAIALGDLKNKASVWETLYTDSVSAFADE